MKFKFKIFPFLIDCLFALQIQEKERLASIEQEPAISQAMRRRKMIACLPKLFDKIYFFFQSIRRAVVTKEELIQKLISQLDIVDKGKLI